jgi:hypothetical protein
MRAPVLGTLDSFAHMLTGIRTGRSSLWLGSQFRQ